MAGPFFVDDVDNGDDDDGLSWANARRSINSLDAAVAFASGEIVYFGADSQCQATNSADLTITGPTSGRPVVFISSTVGSGTTVSYSVGTGNQIDTTEGNYAIQFDGSFALYGIRCAAGGRIRSIADSDEIFFAETCTFAPGANQYLHVQGSFGANRQVFRNCVVDLTADATTTRTEPAIALEIGKATLDGLTFVNAGYRTGAVLALVGPSGATQYTVTGADFSGFTQAAIELVDAGVAGSLVMSNCLTHSTWTPTVGTPRYTTDVMMTNVGPADAPTYLYWFTGIGTVASSASIYRTGGATVEGDACSWLITTTANCSEASPFYTPWIYGTVSSTGSKTFTLYITNDTADFTDAEVWLEVESLSTADEAIWALATDQRATITTTAAAQTDDTTSSWVGLNDAGQGLGDYMQSLAVTATVNETGQFRARVAVGVASIAGSRYFYVDPKVTVS